MKKFLFLLLLLPTIAFANIPTTEEIIQLINQDKLSKTEIRCCEVPLRDADGSIYRNASVLYWFKKAHPCPSTHLTSGACPGWIMDHVIPLACGGVDAVWNIQWLPIEMWKEKSKWERVIYGGNGMSEGCP